MITPSNIMKHELIGLEVEVVESRNKKNLVIRGVVVDETKNMLIIKTMENEKRIPKKYTKFMFRINEKKVKVDGSLIVAQPEDRIRLKVKKW